MVEDAGPSEDAVTAVTAASPEAVVFESDSTAPVTAEADGVAGVATIGIGSSRIAALPLPTGDALDSSAGAGAGAGSDASTAAPEATHGRPSPRLAISAPFPRDALASAGGIPRVVASRGRRPWGPLMRSERTSARARLGRKGLVMIPSAWAFER